MNNVIDYYLACRLREFNYTGAYNFVYTSQDNVAYIDNTNTQPNDIIAPTYMELLDWFRVEHKIFITHDVDIKSTGLVYEFAIKHRPKDDVFPYMKAINFALSSDFYTGLNEIINYVFDILN